jgi:hypothetical protein
MEKIYMMSLRVSETLVSVQMARALCEVTKRLKGKLEGVVGP